MLLSVSFNFPKKRNLEPNDVEKDFRGQQVSDITLIIFIVSEYP